jgi:transforming growth factor-beta-induced protein
MPSYGPGKAGPTRQGGYGPQKSDQPAQAAADNSIMAAAQAAGGLDTLLAAATPAGLAEALASNGPFTVFAPVDTAFAELPQAAVNNLLQPENRGTLASLLQHHVLSGRIDAAGVIEAGELEILAGTPLTVEVEGDEVRIGGVRIVQTNIGADNGIIHVVEQVLFPEGFACIATGPSVRGSLTPCSRLPRRPA